MAKKLSAMPFSSIAAGRLGDLSYLLRGPYEEQLRRDMAQAIPVAFDQLDGLRQDQAPKEGSRASRAGVPCALPPCRSFWGVKL